MKKRDVRNKPGGTYQAQGTATDNQYSLPTATSQSQGAYTSTAGLLTEPEGSAPELRSTYHDSFGGSGGFLAPLKRFPMAGKQVQVVNPVPPAQRENNYSMAEQSRINSLEDRLINQERAAQSILDRSMRIKEDVVENLNITHSTWQGERRQRELLQEHIRSVTELVRKMDRDIRVLEEQIRVKDSFISNSGSTLKSLELQQATALTDIRGRIARIDAAIAKLASDIQSCQDGVKGASGSQQTTYQKLQDKIQALELKVAESTHKTERNNNESLIKAQSKETDSVTKTAILETRLTSSIDEVKSLLNTQKQNSDTEREKALNRLTLDMEKHRSGVQDRLGKLEMKVDLALGKLNTELKSLRSSSNSKDTIRQQQDMEKRITQMVTNALRSQNDTFLRLKNECRQGFATVHDSITNSKHVLEGKLTLSEEQLRKELGHIKKMVVLV